jgi:uncharacterized membrane protein
MAGLYAIAYPDAETAHRAFDAARGLEEAGYLTILEQAIVTKSNDGDVEVEGVKHPVRKAAVAGGVIGALAGLVFFAPVAGAAVGASIGGILGKGDASGAKDEFKSFSESVSHDLPNGGAAVVILGQTEARERVIQTLGQFGGTVRSYDISKEELEQIQKQVNRASSV